MSDVRPAPSPRASDEERRRAAEAARSRRDVRDRSSLGASEGAATPRGSRRDVVVSGAGRSPVEDALATSLGAPSSTLLADALAEPSAERRAALLHGVWSRAVAEGSVELARLALSALALAARAG
ncbi:hypothetical protein L6R52_34405, partial [Myxococcota bacterium]|nr:hypothetical protein [Myxococcota bacterium]